MDRNKTPLTHDVTTAAIMWLDDHGFKPTETEVQVASGWIADLASVIHPTRSESSILRLVRRKPPYSRDGSRQIEWESVYQGIPKPLTAIVEVKTTRADFRKERTIKWAACRVADLQFIAMPEGMIPDHEWPASWSVLLMREDKTIKFVPSAPMFVSVQQRLNVVTQIAMRRDHHTRYERLRAQNRTERDRINDGKTLTRWSTTFRVVSIVMRGGKDRHWRYTSVEDVLKTNNVRGLSADAMSTLHALWNGVTHDAGNSSTRDQRD